MKIKSILIANRGEIAIRIANTARKMGIKSYGIKTSKEPGALYLKFVDHICDFTENLTDTTEFLNIDSIINFVKEKKIDAIHPGYGFLAESSIFAERCEKEKIIFIGPSADSIYKMGNKTIAKEIAHKQNIPLLSGSNGTVKDAKEAASVAKKVGFPVILKAAAGGGGRGMRIVEKHADVEKLFNMASSESLKAFNDGSMFIEKYVRNPRHIEFQIVGDKHGNIVHLGERECSVQRKHQKLIEESPSAALSDKLRKTMGDAAVKLAQAVDYFSTGTVEFLLDSDKKFYFMEMNTRIQVEHPVTEAITGYDLVEMQIRIAQGEKLPMKQEDVKFKGWAIEYRINAEDVQAAFSPSLGTIQKIIFPQGKNIRIDSGVTNKSAITPYFDSMVAKIICTGETRLKAIENSLTALNKLWIKGIKTTIPFHKAVLKNKNFIKGNYNTSFIEKEMKKLYNEDEDAEMLAAIFATFDYASEIESDQKEVVDYNTGKFITPWVLKRRLKSM